MTSDLVTTGLRSPVLSRAFGCAKQAFVARRIEPELFPKFDPSDAGYFGAELASWWLPGDWRAAARLPDPPVDLKPGTTLVLCVWKAPAPPWVTVAADRVQRERPVRGLPLLVQWVLAAGHDSRLPQGLAETADRALALEVAAFSEDPAPWRLRLGSELGDVDLSGLRIDAQSAMVSLIAALRLARLGARAAPRVLATGCVDEDGRVCSVRGETLRDKVRLCAALADSWGGVVRCFVPAAQLSTERSAEVQDPRVELRSLPWQDRPNLATALMPLLAELDLEPSAEQSVEPFDPATNVHIGWANRDHILRDARRERHYLTHIVGPLARHHRESLGLSSTARLATAVGMVPGAVALATLVHGADALCLVTTEESLRAAALAIVSLLKLQPTLGVHEVRQRHSGSLRNAVEAAGGSAPWTAAHLTASQADSDEECVAQVAIASVSSSARLSRGVSDELSRRHARSQLVAA